MNMKVEGTAGVRRRSTRQTTAKVVGAVAVLGAIVTALLVATVGIAFANAANPLPTSTGTATVNPDGSVDVNVSGTWDWQSQNGCTARWGVGWALDWGGISTNPNPSPSLQIK